MSEFETTHNEIMRAIGRIEGGIEGINKRLDVVNGRLSAHGTQIDDLKDFNSNLKGKIAVIGTMVGTAGYFIGLWIKKHFID